jgi:hypothetical protein
MAKSSKRDKSDKAAVAVAGVDDAIAAAAALVSISPATIALLKQRVDKWALSRKALETDVYKSELLSYAILGHMIENMPNTKDGDSLRVRCIDQRRKVSELLLMIEPETGAKTPDAKGQSEGKAFLAAAARTGSVKSGRRG